MTYLGKLPSEANLTLAQKRELLTYHRAKQGREQICPDCKSVWRSAVRKCYFCDKEYSEERGMLADDGDVAALLNRLGGGAELTDDEAAKRLKSLEAKARQRGVVMLDKMSPEERKAFIAEAKEKGSRHAPS